MLKLTASTPRFPLCRKTSGREKPATFLPTNHFFLSFLPATTWSSLRFPFLLQSRYQLVALPAGSASSSSGGRNSAFRVLIGHCFLLAAACSPFCCPVICCCFLWQEAAGDVSGSVPSPTTTFGRVSQRTKKKLHSVLSSGLAVIYFWQHSSL